MKQNFSAQVQNLLQSEAKSERLSTFRGTTRERTKDQDSPDERC